MILYDKYILNSKTNLWDFKNYLGNHFYYDSLPCDEREYDKLVGLLAVFYSNKIPGLVELNFSNNTICYNSEPNLEDYTELEFVIKKDKMIYFTLVYNKKPIHFLFDTGYQGDLIIQKEYIGSFKPDKVYIGALLGSSRELISSQYDIADNQNVQFAENESLNLNLQVLSSEGIKHNLVGVNFIKNFDWIVDYQKKRIFVKKIADNPIPYKYPTNAYGYSVHNDELKLIVKDISVTELDKYPLFKPILSINNDTINESNWCNYAKYLNEIENLKTVDIVYK